MVATRDLVTLVTVLLLAGAGVDARVFKGASTFSSFPFVGKFAFGRSGGGQAAGHQTLSYTKTLDSSQQPNLTLWEWDDNDFASFNFRTASCGQIISPDHLTFSIPLAGHDGTVSNEFLENRAPHFWFFAIGAYPYCPPVGAEWTMTVTQEDGSQLSYDELGLPTLFAIFFVLFLGGFVAHVWAHYVQTPRFSPLLVILFSASLGSFLASIFFKLIRYGSISATGIDSLACAGLALAFHAAANVFILIVCGLAAVGYGVSSSRLFQLSNVLPLCVLFTIVVIYLAGLGWVVTAYDPTATTNATDSWPFITVAVLTIAYGAWFVWATRQTMLRESHTLRREVLFRILVTLGSSFAVLPLLGIVGAATPDTEATRVWYGLDSFAWALVYGAACWALWPSKARDAFKPFNPVTGMPLDSLPGADGADFYFDGGGDGPSTQALGGASLPPAGMGFAYEALKA